jgi:hypothetical protein
MTTFLNMAYDCVYFAYCLFQSIGYATALLLLILVICALLTSKHAQISHLIRRV